MGPGRAPPLPRLAESIPLGQLGDECGLGHVLILHDAQECGQRKHGKKAVEDGCTAHDDRHAVRRQEQACEECDGGGSEQVLSESAQKEYGDDAADGRRDAPSHGVGLAEELHAHRDQPLARRRVDGVAAHRGQAGGVAVGERGVDVFRPRSLVSEGEERPGILHVVGLVEDERADVAQSGQSNDRGHQRRNRCRDPPRCGRR